MTQARVQYTEGQVLSAADLNDEQAYLVSLCRAHNLGPHDWGIRAGLDLIYSDGLHGTLMLTPGAAVDGFGRELYVPEPVILTEALFQRFYQDASSGPDRWLDFWLRYACLPRNSPEIGPYSYRPDESNRCQEQARLCATRPLSDAAGNLIQVDPRCPPGVPSDDMNVGPQDELLRDPDSIWPVYVGRVNWPVGKPPKPDPDVQRPYAVLVGAVVRSASRQPVPDDPQNPSPAPLPPVERAQMELAPALSGKPLFAVRVPDTAGKLAERVAINRAGEVRLTGHLTVVSDLPATSRSSGALLQSETGLISHLSLGESAVKFKQNMIANPARLASRLRSGSLPMSTGTRDHVNGWLDDILAKPVDPLDPRQQLKIRRRMAKVLNYLVNDPTLADPRLIGQVRLSQATRAMLRSRRPGDDYRPLNRRIITDVFGQDLVPEDMPGQAWSLEMEPLPEEPKAARPWQMYRVEKKAEDGSASSELRFELADPGQKDNPVLYQLAIGCASDTAKSVTADAQPVATYPMQPCLTVDAACNVTVNGNMYYEGELVVNPVAADPSNPAFLAQLIQAWEQAMAAGILANAELKVKISSLAVDTQDKTKWSYTFTLTNAKAAAVTGVAVYEIYSINGVTSSTILVAQIDQVGPSPQPPVSKPVDHTQTPALKTGDQLGLVAIAIGFAPNGVALYGSDNSLITV